MTEAESEPRRRKEVRINLLDWQRQQVEKENQRERERFERIEEREAKRCVKQRSC